MLRSLKLSVASRPTGPTVLTAADVLAVVVCATG